MVTKDITYFNIPFQCVVLWIIVCSQVRNLTTTWWDKVLVINVTVGACSRCSSWFSVGQELWNLKALLRLVKFWTLLVKQTAKHKA